MDEASQEPGASEPAPDVNATTIPPDRAQYLTPITLDAVEGDLFPVTSVATGISYTNETIGVTLRYPDDWMLVEQDNQRSVAFYPPGANPQQPGPLITLSFLPDRPYNPDDPLIATGTEVQPVLVGEVEGHQYRDDEYAIPTQSSYIELPHRGGTIFIAATRGPYVNLVPQLEEILTTVTFD
jgi:hypothetical protein